MSANLNADKLLDNNRISTVKEQEAENRVENTYKNAKMMFTFLNENIGLFKGRKEKDFGYSRKEEGSELKKELTNI